MQRGAQAAILVVLAMSILPSCKSETFRGPAEMSPLSESEADTLAASLIEVVGSCEEPGLEALFDREWFLRTAAQNSGSSAGDKKQRYNMLSAEENVRRDLLCIPGAEVAYLGTRKRALGQVLVIRATKAEQSDAPVNYYEFLVGKGESGEPRCLDRLDYQGGWMASTLLGAGPTAMDEVQALASLGALVASGAPETAKRIQDETKKYPESMRLRVMLVDVAASSNDDEYRRALATYLERSPTDLRVYLQVFTSLANRGAFALADEALVALQDGLGDDYGLLSTRVSLMLESKDFARATQLSEAALSAHPGDQEAHYRLLEVHALSRNFPAAVAVMRLLGERFNVRFTEEGIDTSHPAYVELLASDAWAAY